MAKATQFAAAIATAICFSSLVGSAVANSHPTLFVEGRVYCDQCRAQFETKLSEPVESATVALECRTRDTEEVVYTHEVETDKNGAYMIPAESGHAELICEVVLVRSPDEECNEIIAGASRARIVLSTNSGVAEPVRHANALGFMAKEAVAGCDKVLEDMGINEV
ncbi:Pollen-specific protein-like [Melia azedarach]|uniref:Pollen-specific protein-like n=1 Tax=Melia azedarach TaxID=155640 RepID=A0ACC1YTS3_MELAZ|nr:Pollen-specific protein-like [Melia azedarach]